LTSFTISGSSLLRSNRSQGISSSVQLNTASASLSAERVAL
jgi:hypothetical protein